jgi:hypothetical protein
VQTRHARLIAGAGEWWQRGRKTIKPFDSTQITKLASILPKA